MGSPCMWSVKLGKSREGVERTSEGDWRSSLGFVAGGDACNAVDVATMGKEMGIERREKDKGRERRQVIWR